ncbi:MAG: PHP domain-containing protein [Acidobacteriota bacterium]
MNLNEIDTHLMDLHLHTFASDGEMSGDEILDIAAEIGLQKISITDHDGLGVHITDGKRLKEKGSDSGIELITGIELDSEYNGIEVHILGYDLDIHNKNLLQHLEEIHFLRKKRIGEILDKVNLNLGKKGIPEKDIFVKGRETLMKPHIVRELLKKDIFSSYKDAAKWISKNCPADTIVPKLPSEDIVKIIKDAGGKAVIAHPGYYIHSGKVNLDTMITDLLRYGLDGVEVFYDYFKLSPGDFSRSYQKEILALIRRKTEKYGLFFTRGSDAHNVNEMRERNTKAE